MALIALCIDRDDDLGKKAGIKGPLFGEKDCLNAAMKLGISDPEDSDTNSFLACIKEFKERDDIIDCVIITGHPKRGIDADKEVIKQLDKVLKKYPNIEGCIFISDGSDDEQLIPIIQNKINVISIKRVIVKQQKELEKGYYVIKEAIKDPDMAKIFLGIPGIIIFLLSFGEIGFRFVLFTIGTFLILRGFGVDKKIYDAIIGFTKSTELENNSFPLYLGSVMIFLLSVVASWFVYQNNIDKDTFSIIYLIGIKTIPLISISIILFIIGRIIDLKTKLEKLKKYLYLIPIVITTSISVYSFLQLLIGYFDLTQFMSSLIISIIIYFIIQKIINRLFKKIESTNLKIFLSNHQN